MQPSGRRALPPTRGADSLELEPRLASEPAGALRAVFIFLRCRLALRIRSVAPGMAISHRLGRYGDGYTRTTESLGSIVEVLLRGEGVNPLLEPALHRFTKCICVIVILTAFILGMS